MTGQERLRDYLFSLEPEPDPLCGQIEADALVRGIPIVKRETGAFLEVLAAMKRPGAILEIGTAVGYSAVRMARAAPDFCRITTIEKDRERADEARKNVCLAGLSERITVVCGDADGLLERIPDETFDLVFLDAAKGQYGRWSGQIRRILKPSGVLAADNVLQDMTVLESRFAVKRRDRTIHARMRDFLWELRHCEEFWTAVVPVGDGVALAVKKEKEDV